MARLFWLGSLFLAAAFAACFIVAQEDEGEDGGLDRLPFCSPKSKGGFASSGNDVDILIVSTLDGKITALNPHGDDGGVLWSVSTEPGDMVSSTISQMELTNSAQWVRLIPSLAGGLYKFDGETVEGVPLSAETLLESSFKFADNTIITGGVEKRIYGIERDSGRVRYECTMDRCTNYGDDNMDDVMVVQRFTQTVRAVELRTGQEKWNFSVSQHHVELTPGVEELCKPRGDDVDEDKSELNDSTSGVTFKAVVSDGVICSVDRTKPDEIKWRHRFDTPIVHAWQVVNGNKLIKVDLLSSSASPQRGESIEDAEFNLQSPMLYIGTYKKQLYIQESARLEKSRLSLDNDKRKELDFPRVTWRPYLISSKSRTPVYNHGLKAPSQFPLLTFDEKVAENTALSVFSGSEYPFDSGMYLFPDEPTLEYDPILDYKDDGDQEGVKVGEGVNTIASGSAVKPTLMPEEAPAIQVVFVSIWYWWKEVIFISILTGLLMNVLFTRRIVFGLKQNFRRRLEALANRRPSVVVVEVPVPVPQRQQSGDPSSQSKAALTPGTDSSASLNKEFSWSRSDSGEFVSRFVSDFEALQCLGKGGFGVVFECKNNIDDNRYAVKRIKLPCVEEAKKKVMREVKCLAKLDHKYIVRYYNAWLENPPPGWQESQDRWWKETETTQAGISTVGSSSNLEEAGNFSLDTSDTSPKEDQMEPSLNLPLCRRTDQSVSIVFESSSKSVAGPSATSSPSSDGSSPSSSTSASASKCDDALAWEEAEKRKKIQREKPLYLYIVMQLCQKESLKDYLRSVTINRTRQQSLLLFHQICLGVDYVHSQGLIHRDLKPGNIFFSTDDGTVKIGDFGLVTGQLDSDNQTDNAEEPSQELCASVFSPSSTQHTDQVGTELYMSPEQLGRRSYDRKVDVYSLGLVLFELLVPFSTQMERLKTMSEVRKLQFPDHFLKDEALPLVQSMLSHNPERRPEVADVLEKTNEFIETIPSTMTSNRRRTYTSSSTSGLSEDAAGALIN